MATIDYIIVDDDLLNAITVQHYAQSQAVLVHKGTYTSATEGLLAIETFKPTLVFLDIEMPNISGLEVLRKAKASVEMAVFITSHPEFAIDGFELSAIDYIIKPFTEERFQQCIKRVLDFWDMKQKAALFEIAFEAGTITIKDGHNRINIKKNDIIYVEAMQDYTKVVTTDKNYLTLSTLTHFIDQFNNNEMLRIHRSFAVATKKITQFNNTEIICGNHILPVGKTYKNNVAQLK